MYDGVRRWREIIFLHPNLIFIHFDGKNGKKMEKMEKMEKKWKKMEKMEKSNIEFSDFRNLEETKLNNSL